MKGLDWPCKWLVIAEVGLLCVLLAVFAYTLLVFGSRQAIRLIKAIVTTVVIALNWVKRLK